MRAAAQYAGPAIVLYFIIPAVGCAIAGLSSVMLALLGGLFPIGALGEMVSIGTLLAFAIVCVSIIVLRRTHPELARPFKTPLVPLVPALGAAICIAQMGFLPWATWLRLIIWMAIGMAIYFFYGRHHSKLAVAKEDSWNK